MKYESPPTIQKTLSQVNPEPGLLVKRRKMVESWGKKPSQSISALFLSPGNQFPVLVTQHL